MKKAITIPNQPATQSELSSLADCRARDTAASESNAMMRDFAEDLQSLLETIASLCEALHAPAMDHWTLSQHKVIDALQKSIREAATVVDQVCIVFEVPKQSLNAGQRLNATLTH